MPDYDTSLSSSSKRAGTIEPPPAGDGGERERKRSIAKILFGASTVFFITGVASALIYARRTQAKFQAEEAARAGSSPEPVEPTRPTLQADLPSTTPVGEEHQPLVLPSRAASAASSSARLVLPRRPTTRIVPPESLALSPLHAFGAFGLATLAVVGLAGATVWTVKRAMGVETVDEFAVKARRTLARTFPALNQRIHRALEATDRSGPTGAVDPAPRPQLGEEAWNTSDAWERLTAAYERGGANAWAEQFEREAEAEREWEMRKRAAREGKRDEVR